MFDPIFRFEPLAMMLRKLSIPRCVGVSAMLAIAIAAGGNAAMSQETLQGDPVVRDVIIADNCEVKPINKVEVAARVDGVLDQLKFVEGDEVTRDSVLATVDSEEADLMIRLKMAEEKEAQVNAANDVNRRDAEASAAVAEAEYQSFKSLYREKAVPYWELEKKKLEAGRQRLRIELAETEGTVAKVRYIAKKSEREMAEYQKSKHEITAPVTGIVERRIGQLGQWCQPGTPIAEVIQMDKLRVAGSVDALRYPGAVRKGKPVNVVIKLGTQEIEISGTLGYVSLNVDVRDRNEIWVDLDNRRVDGDWLIKPGVKASIEILP